MDVAVIGAGRMGQGIAQAFAMGGHQTCLIDRDESTAQVGLSSTLDRIGQAAQRRKITVDAAQDAQNRLSASTLDAIGTPDLVVEAVFEDLTVKREVFAHLAKLPATTIIATNTSSFRVADLADACGHPERVLGLHFFYPAHQNPLVEVVGTDDTDGTIIHDMTAAMKDIGKTPIQARDSPGFAVNRFLLPLANEACRLVDEGHPPGDVEASGALAFGIPYGPFMVMDLSGPTVCWQAQSTLHAALGEWYAPATSMTTRGATGERWNVRPGTADHHVAIRLRAAVFRAAKEMVDEGVATSADADIGARVGLMWPVGPFEMMAMPGVDVEAEMEYLDPKRAA